MKKQYYDFYGRPAIVTLDEEDIPDTCEVFNTDTAAFETRDDLLLDVCDSYGSYWLPEEKFLALLEKAQRLAGKVE